MTTEENDTLDFDQFWETYSEQDTSTRTTVKIKGRRVILNTDVPLALVNKLMSTDTDDLSGMSNLVGELFPDEEGLFDFWLANEITMRQIGVILAWCLARIQGRNITFEEVATQMSDFLADPELTQYALSGVPLNRASRRLMERQLKNSPESQPEGSTSS